MTQGQRTKQPHYLPRHYLRGFCNDTSREQLYVYTKGGAAIYRAGIHNIAKEKDYYLPEIEDALARSIESNAEPVLKRIRAREPLLNSDRKIVAAFIVCLWKRVPSYREIVRQLIPNLTCETLAGMREQFIDREPDLDTRERNRIELETLEAKWKDGPPEAVKAYFEQPFTTGMIEDRLLVMHWYFAVAAGDTKYVTSDNPVFFFRAIGLNKPESELSCPLSRDIALLCTGAEQPWRPYAEVPDRIVREFNRRSIHNATRYVYYCEQAQWLQRMIVKPRIRLNRIMSQAKTL
ncbi:MAG TPA: DUF4238 domain-containing protein [Candidatus Krumholzibacteria bacterium]|nr:DUF4238 domain-containing protein [Candidatus Krumholzibacteria bacterium]HPD73283.1 DUF4238 domain-containing protein [Candidatus Krumholzibacteria bacterium]HRY41999.1 DUF4238 domain-containing protein [Candidatus Krumholzibacteria bacterium]